MSAHFARAQVLLEQSRYDLAETELRRALADEPSDPYAHALLAQCLAELDKLGPATAEAREAIRLAPDAPMCHFVLAQVLLQRDRIDEADVALAEAIRLDPEDANFYSLQASIRYHQRGWVETLQAARQGLAIDPENVGCTNLEAMALVQLGRKDEAGRTIATALAREPENAISHANMGWTLLRKGQHRQAMEHFRESLRLEPNNEWARHGIVEALKARNPIYRWMLAYFFWMSTLSSRAQWGVLIGLYFVNRFVSGLSRTNPELRPVLLPLMILYIAFAFLTWNAAPLFNLLLRLNRFGRLALSRQQIIASNLLGVCLLGAFACLGAWAATRQAEWVEGAIVLALLTMPISATFNCSAGWPRVVMIVYTSLMAALGLCGAAGQTLIPPDASGALHVLRYLSGLAFGAFLLGILACFILGNVLPGIRPKK